MSRRSRKKSTRPSGSSRSRISVTETWTGITVPSHARIRVSYRDSRPAPPYRSEARSPPKDAQVLGREEVLQTPPAQDLVAGHAEHALQGLIEGDHLLPAIAAQNPVHGAVNEPPLKADRLQEFPGGLHALLLQERGVVRELLPGPVPLLRPLEGELKGVLADGLGHEVRGVELKGPNGHVHLAVGRGHHDLHLRVGPLDLLQDPKTAHAGHSNVRDHDLGPDLLHHLEARRPVRGRGDLVPRIRQGDAQDLADVRLVIDQHDPPCVLFTHGLLPRQGPEAAGMRQA